MGSLEQGLRSSLEEAEQRGMEVRENAEQKIDEAQESKEALDQIEAIDDDDKAALQEAINESRDIAQGIAENEITTPGSEISSSLEGISEQSSEYSETEIQDSEKASGTIGDFQGPGAELASKLQESGESFRELADESSEMNEEMQSEFQQDAATLESVF